MTRFVTVLTASAWLLAACATAPDPGLARADFDALVDGVTTDLLRESPEFATYLGVDEATAGGPYLGRLSGYGLAGRADTRALVADARARIEAIDPGPLDESRRLTRLVLLDQLGAGARADAAAGGWGSPGFGSFGVYPVNQMTGLHIDLPNMMAAQQPVTSTAEADAFIERLRGFGAAFDGAIEGLEADADAGAILPDFVIDKTLAVLARFTAPAPTENVLYTAFAQKLADADVPEAEAHQAAAEAAIRDVVYPAYARLASALEALRPRAVHDAGLSHQPNGAALYDAMIRIGADSALTADQVHDLGLGEVARITAEADAILDSVGRAEGTVAERFQALNADAGFVRPNTVDGKASIVADIERQIAEVEPLLPAWFGTVPPQPVEVRPVPGFSEASAAPAYYDTPSLDGTRPGIYWINLRDTAIHPMWLVPSVTYHEAIPGHHMQLALAFSQRDLPLVRQIFGSTTAYAEGWGLYAERLAKEMGLYEDDPYGDLGRLRSELWRAVRLVVDSGLHAKGWSREQAIAYMIDVGGIDPDTAEQEVERYVIIPGQALGYKIGMLKILELRERARDALGDGFDIRAFHDAVLLDAGLPLSVLEARIDAWIAEQGGS
jgi:uncharacterized protein (DUF885 family)